MLVDLYLEVWKGMKKECVRATADPSPTPPAGWTRLRVTVDIPDHFINPPPECDLGVVKAGQEMK